VVNFSPREKAPRYNNPLAWKLGEPQSQFKRYTEEKNVLSLLEIEH
jgi:hypothetical protein